MKQGELAKMASKNIGIEMGLQRVMSLGQQVESVRVEELDVERAAASLLRLQEFYFLQPRDVIQGHIRNYSACRHQPKLTLVDSHRKIFRSLTNTAEYFRVLTNRCEYCSISKVS